MISSNTEFRKAYLFWSETTMSTLTETFTMSLVHPAVSYHCHCTFLPDTGEAMFASSTGNSG
jgi:hypothetical protein